MRWDGLVLATALTLCVVGCESGNDSPKGVLNQAYQAIQTNNGELYMQTLDGEALRNCGDLAGMMSLQKEIKQFLGVSVQEPKLVWIEQNDWHQDIKHLYSVEVSAAKTEPKVDLRWDLTIRCDITPRFGYFSSMNCKIITITGAAC